MSELINTHDNRATIRWKLLTGASALALTAYISSTGLARADDTDRPTIWIELGGETQMMQGLSDPFTAPFMSRIADIGLSAGKSFIEDQRPVRFALGLDGSITFQPKDSDWLFSASIRYARAHSKRHVHNQEAGAYSTFSGYPNPEYDVEPFRDVNAPSSEHHMVLDFSAGKDVGIGVFGHDGSSVISAGVRAVQFAEGETLGVYVRPVVNVGYRKIYGILLPTPTFAHQYSMTAHADRSFKGIGPLLSWKASADLAGNAHDGELALDWGIDAAVLFGRQKAKTDHATQTYHRTVPVNNAVYAAGYHYGPYHSTRSKRIAAPDFGAFAGLSYRFPNAKVSIGYRYDMFFKTVDAGIDARDASDLTFNGPYASISIGLGGSSN